MMKAFTRATTSFIFIFFCQLCWSQSAYYIAVTGSDANPCTSENPCATIQYVHDNHIVSGANDTIYLAGSASQYTESNIQISKTDVHIIGPTGLPAAELNGSGKGTAARCFHVQSEGVRFKNLTINSYNTTNAAYLDGAGIRFEDFNGTGKIENCTIKNCVAGGGGAIYTSVNTPGYNMDITITNCVLKGNTADVFAGSGNGGAIVTNQIPGATLNMTINGASSIGATNEGNTAEDGGGIYFEGNYLNILNTDFIDNSVAGASTTGGGGLFMLEGTAIIDSTRFLGNSAGSSKGGAVYASPNSNLNIRRNSKIGDLANGNTAERGGGIFFNGDTLLIEKSEITNNTASYIAMAGGGLYFNNGIGELSKVIISNNSTSDGGLTADGGGVIFSNASSLVLNKCILHSNSSDDNGGAIFTFQGNQLEMTNCLVYENTCKDRGAGVYLNATNTAITNCTFAHNTAETLESIGMPIGGAIESYASSGLYNVNLKNVIAYYNSTGGNLDIRQASNTIINVENSNIDVGSFSGTDVNNIDADPLFSDVLADDYSLDYSSPSIDVGSNIGAPSDDILNVPRLETVDMGAYELEQTLFLEELKLSAKVGNETVVLNWESSNNNDKEYFEIERSSDDTNFSKIDSIKCYSIIEDYTFIDESPFSRKSYYRVKKVNPDSTAIYSNKVTVGYFALDLLDLYPNPVKDEVNVMISTSLEMTLGVQVLNMAGQRVMQLEKNVVIGKNELSFNTSGLAPQKYVLMLTTDKGGILRKEFVKR